VPNFFCKFHKNGLWKYDWIKFIAVGLPTLYITLSVLTTSMLPHTVSEVVFGLIILSSFYKINK